MSENTEKKKQISLVLESPINYEELKFLESFKKFIKKFPELQITGTHIKKRDNF